MHLILDMPEGMVQQTLIYVSAFYVHLDGKFFIILPMFYRRLQPKKTETGYNMHILNFCPKSFNKTKLFTGRPSYWKTKLLEDQVTGRPSYWKTNLGEDKVTEL